MNVEIWTEVAQFLFGEYINRIFIAVQESEVFWTRDTRDTDSIRTALVTPIGAERLGKAAFTPGVGGFRDEGHCKPYHNCILLFILCSPERQKLTHRIPQASGEDGGTYRCHVITPFDSRDSGPARLSLRSEHPLANITRRCRLSLLTNSALVYESQCGVMGRGCSLFNLCTVKGLSVFPAQGEFGQ
jgi:hypothetical protein